jgi:hypothetical protein
MPKALAPLIAVALLACNRLPGGSGAREMVDFEQVSDEILTGSFVDTEELGAFLNRRAVAHTIREESDELMIVQPSVCAPRVGSDFKFGYLRLHGNSGPKIYLYRLYWGPMKPLCIEPDFAFKNPYG